MAAQRGFASLPDTPKFDHSGSVWFQSDAFNKENDTNGTIIARLSPGNRTTGRAPDM
jgi:hypothetical protein